MASSKMVVGRSSGVIGFERSSALKSESDKEDGKISRYRIGWDALAMATLPDNGAGTLEVKPARWQVRIGDFGRASEIIPLLL
jgi:hypothetical protein